MPRGDAVEPGAQGSAPKAILAAALVIGLGTIAAHGCSANWSVKSEMEQYLKAGSRQGAASLQRDLLRDHPLGSAIGPVLVRLGRLGFDCGAALDPDRPGACRFRGRRGDRQVTTVLVELGHDGQRLGALAVRMSVTQP